MTRLVLSLSLVFFLVGCGKNDGTYPIPPVSAAPPPPSGFYPGPGSYPSGSGYPGSGYAGYPGAGYGGYPGGYPGSYPGSFVPQMPSGFPPSYYPFLPINNFFQQTPQGQAYWQGFWQGWVQYAANQGYSPYNFTPFWTQYAANQWGNGPYVGLYNAFNTNVYYWVTPQTQFPAYADPSAFWGSYIGMPYSSFSSDCGCGF